MVYIHLPLLNRMKPVMETIKFDTNIPVQILTAPSVVNATSR